MYENTSKRIKIVFGISFASYFLVAISIFLLMRSTAGGGGFFIASFIIPCSFYFSCLQVKLEIWYAAFKTSSPMSTHAGVDANDKDNLYKLIEDIIEENQKN